jgi:5-methylcytosine-specific restriction endonuclease McrA
MMRFCLEEGCRRLTPKTRCEEHRRAEQRRIDARRGSPLQRGYTQEYRRNRMLVLQASAYVCAYCGGRATTVDHQLPLARGGSNDVSNLLASCTRCNSRKGARV